MCSNIRGLRNNFTELKYVIRKRKPNICFLNETHLTDECGLSDLKINGYKLINCFSHSKHTGDVSVFIDKKLKFTNLSIIEKDIAWFLSFELSVDKNPIVIAGIYLSASENKHSVLDAFEEWFETIATNKSLVVMGDFNVDLLMNTAHSRRIKNFTSDNGLYSRINKATRIDKNSATLIDLCLTHLNSNKMSCELLEEDQISDHHIIEAVIRGKSDSNINKKREITVWKNYDPERLWNSIESWITEWENIKLKPMNDKLNWLLNNLKCSLNEFRETKQFKHKNDFFDR